MLAFYKNLKLTGAYLEYSTKNSAYDCWLRCEANSKCYASSFSSSKDCYLFSLSYTSTAQSGWISYVIPLKRNCYNFLGSNTNNFSESNESREKKF